MIAYRNTAGAKCPAAIAKLRDDLRAIINAPRPDTAVGLIDAVAQTVKAIEDARAACKLEGG